MNPRLGHPGAGKRHLSIVLTVGAIQASYASLYRSVSYLPLDGLEARVCPAKRSIIVTTNPGLKDRGNA